MAGCISCVVLPLLLFLFHRYLQPLILKFWNPWAIKDDKSEEGQNGFACPLNKLKCEREKIKTEGQNMTEPGRLKSE